MFKGGKGRAAVEEDRYDDEDHNQQGADSGGGGCSRHDNFDDKGRKATRPEPKEQGQQRWMMKRSLQQQSTGEGRAAKTPRVMRALPATTTTEGEQDLGSGGQSLPVVRSLTGAFRDQPPASPHQGKRPQDSSIHSPSRDPTKGRAMMVGPSPRKGRAQGRLPAMATILPDSIVESLQRYIANKDTFLSTPDILAEFKRFTERSNIGASALANTAVVAGDSAFEALKMLITLQSLMADTVRKQYLIPVENLTPNGLLPTHHSWSTLKANNAEGHRYITEILDNINTTTTAAFEKGNLLFDPVSIAFFVAIQTLHVQFDKQAARAPFMEFTCQGLALVSPHPPSPAPVLRYCLTWNICAQDLARMYEAIHYLIMSLSALSVSDDLVTRFAHMSSDEFVADRLPPRLQEILQDPNVAANPPAKIRRILKLDITVGGGLPSHSIHF